MGQQGHDYILYFILTGFSTAATIGRVWETECDHQPRVPQVIRRQAGMIKYIMFSVFLKILSFVTAAWLISALLYCRMKLIASRLSWVLLVLVSVQASSSISLAFVCVCVYVAVPTATGDEDVVGLKATVAELREQLSTNNKTKEVRT